MHCYKCQKNIPNSNSNFLIHDYKCHSEQCHKIHKIHKTIHHINKQFICQQQKNQNNQSNSEKNNIKIENIKNQFSKSRKNHQQKNSQDLFTFLKNSNKQQQNSNTSDSSAQKSQVIIQQPYSPASSVRDCQYCGNYYSNKSIYYHYAICTQRLMSSNYQNTSSDSIRNTISSNNYSIDPSESINSTQKNQLNQNQNSAKSQISTDSINSTSNYDSPQLQVTISSIKQKSYSSSSNIESLTNSLSISKSPTNLTQSQSQLLNNNDNQHQNNSQERQIQLNVSFHNRLRYSFFRLVDFLRALNIIQSLHNRIVTYIDLQNSNTQDQNIIHQFYSEYTNRILNLPFLSFEQLVFLRFIDQNTYNMENQVQQNQQNSSNNQRMTQSNIKSNTQIKKISYLQYNSKNQEKTKKIQIKQKFVLWNPNQLQNQNQTQDIQTIQILCSICFCKYQIKHIVLQLKCGHSYHQNCIQQWLKINSKCPICKKDQKNKTQ